MAYIQAAFHVIELFAKAIGVVMLSSKVNEKLGCKFNTITAPTHIRENKKGLVSKQIPCTQGAQKKGGKGGGKEE